jgi:hypothetical protein
MDGSVLGDDHRRVSVLELLIENLFDIPIVVIVRSLHGGRPSRAVAGRRYYTIPGRPCQPSEKIIEMADQSRS